jgi:hypothetical protein
VAERRLVENYFTLWDASMKTVDVLSGHDLALSGDGEFEISVDGTPRNGRRNHIQSSSAAREFYIRDVIHDWAGDRANLLTIERLGGPPAPPALSDEEQVALTASFMRKYADNTMRWNQQALGRPVNSFSFTIDRDTDGALRNQIYIMGKFELADDEALVLDVNLGGAKYFIAPITNIWGTTNEIVRRNGCLNSAQSRANSDGTYTFVVSLADPGRAQLDRPERVPRRSDDAALGRVRGRSSVAGARRAQPGRESSPSCLPRCRRVQPS